MSSQHLQQHTNKGLKSTTCHASSGIQGNNKHQKRRGSIGLAIKLGFSLKSRQPTVITGNVWH
ncbi:hypothetical protein CVS40_0818 [Lucilia cuprina]|nr:hypothetical protein CVS40_0818 [Lucilia cuprina]